MTQMDQGNRVIVKKKRKRGVGVGKRKKEASWKRFIYRPIPGRKRDDGKKEVDLQRRNTASQSLRGKHF
jgi:hypothetical protein